MSELKYVILDEMRRIENECITKFIKYNIRNIVACIICLKNKHIIEVTISKIVFENK
ncbi:MAG: hypothetical protein ACI4U9_00815 [Clostridia bacterium]